MAVGTEIATLPPPGSAPAARNDLSPAPKKEGFALFGRDGLNFFDFLDIINPLQHIPVLSSVYRAITHDEISPAARMAGGGLFGGLIGLGAAIFNSILKDGTGKDMGEHLIAFLSSPAEGSNAGPIMAGSTVPRAQPARDDYPLPAPLTVSPAGIFAQADPDHPLAQPGLLVLASASRITPRPLALAKSSSGSVPVYRLPGQDTPGTPAAPQVAAPAPVRPGPVFAPRLSHNPAFSLNTGLFNVLIDPLAAARPDDDDDRGAQASALAAYGRGQEVRNSALGGALPQPVLDLGI